MPSMVLVNIPEDLHRRLILEAERRGRTPNEEAIELLNRALPRGAGVILPAPIIPLRAIGEQEVVAGICEGRE